MSRDSLDLRCVVRLVIALVLAVGVAWNGADPASAAGLTVALNALIKQ